MPYVITTTTPTECICTEADDPNDHRKDCPSWSGRPDVSRRAVATLDEARDTVDAILDDHSDGAPLMRWAAVSAEVPNLPESGGTVGPLPDGTVIEVLPVGSGELAALVPDDPRVLADPTYRAARDAYCRHSDAGLHLANPALADGRHVAESERLIDSMIVAAYNAAQEAEAS